MRRRQFIASGTTLLSIALAGCGHPAVVLDMERASAADIATEVSMTVAPESDEYPVVKSAIENGSATRRGRYDLFDETDIVRVDTAFYEVSETRLARSEVTVYEVLIDFDPAETSPTRGEIAFDELPETDRQRLAPIVSEDDPPRQDGYDMGVQYGSAEEVGNSSVFVPDRQYDILTYDGSRYRVAVNSRTAPEAEYRYEVTPVAASVEAFANQVRARYLFALTDLSEAERDVIETAIDDGYFNNDEDFRSVIDRFRDHERVSGDDFYGTWLVEYEDVEYLAYAEW